MDRIVPQGGWRAPWERARFRLAAWRCQRAWQPLASGQAGVQIDALLAVRPEVLGMVRWPYIHAGWPAEARFRVFCQHYTIVEREQWLQVPVGSRWMLMSLDDLLPDLSLQVDRPRWMIREGELTVSLFRGAVRVYSVAFSLGLSPTAERVAYIGGIQGRSLEGMTALYAEITKALHGCRPRDFLIATVLSMCEALGVREVLGIGNAQRHHRHAYFAGHARKMASTDYDEIWRDRGGVLQADGFFHMPARCELRPLEELPSKKRAMYRRRYELLSVLQAHLGCVARANLPPGDLISEPAQ